MAVGSVRIIAASAIGAVIATALLMALWIDASRSFEWGTPLERTRLALLNAPSILVLTVPVGFFVGTVASIAGRSLRKRSATTVGVLGIVLSGLSLVLVQRVIPDANRAFFELAFRLQAEGGGRVVSRPPPSDIGALTWTELGRHLAELPKGERETFRTFRMRVQYYSVVSLVAAPLVFGTVGLGLVLLVSPRWRAIALAWCALLGWYFVLREIDASLWYGVIPPVTAAWLPSAIAALPLVVVFGRKLMAGWASSTAVR